MIPGEPWRWLTPLATATKVLAPDERLFRRGDRISSIFLIQRGSLELVRTLPDGGAMTLGSFVAGELAGEASLFSRTYHCDAVAMSRVQVLQFPKQAVLATLRSDADAAVSLLAYMARRIQATRLAIELRNVRPLSNRVLAWLALQPLDEEGWATPQGSWLDVARSLGCTHESLYRALAKLGADGRLERRAGRIRLLCR